MKSLITGLLLSFLCLSLNAQPVLTITPGELEYKDVFHRLENAYFINTGNDSLVIDNIYYSHNNFYYIRFDQNWQYPLTIPPGDSILMDCILSGYLNYTYQDTLDTLFISNNGVNPYEYLKIKIDYYQDSYYSGTLQGNISSDGIPVPDADVYFLYGGNFIIAQTTTDASGNYLTELPVGSYSIAAVKDSFYTSFYDQQFDPSGATQVLVDTNGISSADLNLVKKTITQNSVSGKIFDSMTAYPLKKGIVIVRHGTHTPQKVNPYRINASAPGEVYTAFVNTDGSYTVDNIIEPGYYYIQSFSDYFVPSYYDSLGNNSGFWQNADSVYIGSDLTNADIYMPRDSSLGGGIISGMIGITEEPDSIITGAIVYAQSSENNSITYAFSQSNGSFKENFLPYGSYYLVAQKIGYKNAVSEKIVIDSTMTHIEDITLLFSSPSSVPESKIVPDQIELYQNYPNPFNPSTTVEFYLPAGADVTLKVINILGQTVSTLHNGFLNAGSYKMMFNGSGLSSGVYFVSLVTGSTYLIRKILLLK